MKERMKEVLGETQSLCPVCLGKIPARKISEGNSIYLEKACPDHGKQRVLIWRDAETYEQWGSFGKDLNSPQQSLTDRVQGCPYDCGLCPTHKAATCIAIMEVTTRCNLSCPVCFASSNEKDYEPGLSVIKGMFETLLDVVGPCPIQLSGGEPTIRDELPQIAELGRGLGFKHIMVNTNGIRIAEDREYLLNLKQSGVDTIYLQFDGVTNDIYSCMRNRELLESKLKALANCAQAKIGVVLVPTLIPGINDHQLGDIIQLAKAWIPVVKGIHFQPISYFGRHPEIAQNEDRITIPDVLKAIETQTGGEIKQLDFVPRRRKESYCAFAGVFILMEDGRLLPTTNYKYAQSVIDGMGQVYEPIHEHVWRYLNTHWKFTPPENKTICECKTDSWERLYERAKTYCLSISCMPFQDVWNIDLDRLQKCCTHVITPERKLVPLCAYYLTSVSGKRLYPQYLKGEYCEVHSA